MKKVLILLVLLGSLLNAEDGFPDEPVIEEYMEEERSQNKDRQSSQGSDMLREDSNMAITVVGQGVAPTFATSPAQSYALAKRAATADAYRLIAERIKGVRIEGKDTIKNMMVKNSTVNTRVSAMVRNATVVETKFVDGLCEVEMEITISHNDF